MEEQGLRRARTADRDWVRAVHLAHYQTHEGFDAGFEAPLDAALDEVLGHAPSPAQQGLCPGGWVVEARDGRAGCLFVSDAPPSAWRLRLFLVTEPARGRGLGRRLLATAEAAARAAGRTSLVVATHAEHQAACALYARAGFAETARHPVRRWGRRLTEVHWEKPLEPGQGLAPLGGDG